MSDNHFPISNSQHDSGIESLVPEAAPGGGKDGGPTLPGGVGAPLVGSVAGIFYDLPNGVSRTLGKYTLALRLDAKGGKEMAELIRGMATFQV